MATMFPQDLGASIKDSNGKAKPTQGERKVFRFLQAAVKPDSAFTAWFEPLLGEAVGEEPRTVRRGDRIAQLVVKKLPEVTLLEVEALPESERGPGGFGHTGVR